MCCRRAGGCSRTKTLKLLGIEDDTPSFSRVIGDEENGRIIQPSRSASCGQRCLCCFCVVLALCIGVAAGVFLTPREPSWQINRLRLQSLTPPEAGGNVADLRLDFAATVLVRNPNLLGVTTLPGTFIISYKDQELGSIALQGMDIAARGSASLDVAVPISGVAPELAQQILEDIASNQGLLTTDIRSTVATRLTLLKITPDRAFTFEAELMTKCTLTSDVQKLPNFADRRCSSSSASRYALLS